MYNMYLSIYVYMYTERERSLLLQKSLCTPPWTGAWSRDRKSQAGRWAADQASHVTMSPNHDEDIMRIWLDDKLVLWSLRKKSGQIHGGFVRWENHGPGDCPSKSSQCMVFHEEGDDGGKISGVPGTIASTQTGHCELLDGLHPQISHWHVEPMTTELAICGLNQSRWSTQSLSFQRWLTMLKARVVSWIKVMAAMATCFVGRFRTSVRVISDRIGLDHRVATQNGLRLQKVIAGMSLRDQTQHKWDSACHTVSIPPVLHLRYGFYQ